MIIIEEVLMRGGYSEEKNWMEGIQITLIEEPSGISNCASGTLGHNSHVCPYYKI